MSVPVDRVIRCVADVFRNKGVDPPSMDAATKLDGEFGLDSLDYAELVARLEGEFGFDPFAQGTPGEIRTMHDLAVLYDADARAS